MSDGTAGRGYQLAPHELAAQASSLAELGDRTNGLVASASRLAARVPQLGTAPPALHLAKRLRDATGEAGLTGEISAADTELNGFHETLRTALNRYLADEAEISRAFHTTGESA